MWQKLKAAREERGGITAQMNSILKNAENARREMTSDEIRQFDELAVKAEQKANEITTLERRHELDNFLLRDKGDSIFGARDLRNYSILRAIRAKVENRALDGLEREVSDEIAHRHGKPAQGFYFPTEIAVNGMERRDLNLTTGAGAKATFTDPANFIAILRAKTIINQLGATYLDGLHGDLSIPKQTAATSAYWVTEGNAPTESNATIGQVALAPKTVGAFTDLSRKFLIQSSVSAEQFARNDLARVLAIALDAAAINGSGAGAEPTGILNIGGVTTVALGTNGAAPTYAKLVEMETTVASANADMGALAYATSAAARGKLKTTEVVATTGKFIWNDDNTVNGYRAVASTQLPSNLVKGTSGAVCSAAIFGNWSDLVLALWSGIDVLVDPYTNGTSGTVRIVALQDVDIKLRNNESFTKIVDMLTT